MKLYLTILASFFGLLTCAADITPRFSNIDELKAALQYNINTDKTFTITGTVHFYTVFPGFVLDVCDNGRKVQLVAKDRNRINDIRVGCRIQASGRITQGVQNRQIAIFDSFVVLRQPAEGEIPLISTLDYLSKPNIGQLVRIRGIARDCFKDESDPHWNYLALQSEGHIIYSMVYANDTRDFDPYTILGREVEVCGEISSSTASLRKHSGRIILVSGLSYLKPLEERPADLFDAPLLETIDPLSPPEKLSSLGLHRVDGCVLGVWNGNKAVIRTRKGLVVNLLMESGDIPPVGEHVAAVGLPGTDLYHLHLEYAKWKPIDRIEKPSSRILATSPKRLLSNGKGDAMIDVKAHGTIVSMTGIIRHVSTADPADVCFFLESDDHLVRVDVCCEPNVLSQLQIASTVSVVGTCIIDSSSWSSSGTAPKANGILLSIHSAEDITVLKRPSWWTPTRIWTVSAILALALIAFIAWNISLQKLATRKARELAHEQISHAEAELRIEERTRLAIELHDTLSQNLLGVSMQLDAVRRATAPYGVAAEKAIEPLSNALKMTRSELRNCLYDLRSEALEVPDLGTAIRMVAVSGPGNGVTYSIRFNVKRNLLSDQTTHTLLRIIRELSANAVRHGHATNIYIAGSLDNGTLLFSVRDNGIGFDTNRAPGASEGHFGLQGIQERIALIGGTVTIDSRPGKGTKVTISISNARTRNTSLANG